MSAFIWILCIIFACKINVGLGRDDTITKDGTLEGLVSLLQEKDSLKVFRHWNFTRLAPDRPQNSYLELIETLTPWVIAEPRAKLPTDSPSVGAQVKIDCGQPRYSAALTGERRDKPRTLVDLVPFGYDVDKLEVRLLENYDVVDVFVIYESPVTLVGDKKPFFFRSVQHTPRFAKFADKIIYLSSTYSEVVAKIPPHGSKRARYWPLSEVMRSRPLHQLSRLGRTLSTLQSLLEEAEEKGDEDSIKVAKVAMARAPVFLQGMNLETLTRFMKLRELVIGNSGRGHKERNEALILQNDADEIPNRAALSHVRHCRVHNETSRLPIFLPATMYRTNAHWIAQLNDIMLCSPHVAMEDWVSEPLSKAIWITGPRLWPLKYIMNQRHTLRLQARVKCQRHMGFGAANHFSSIAEPGEVLMKEVSVIEGSRNDLSDGFITRGAMRQLNPAAIVAELVRPRCGQKVNTRSLTSEERTKLRTTLPVALQLYPDRYPFITPGMAAPEYAGHFNTTASPDWIKSVKCNKQVWS